MDSGSVGRPCMFQSPIVPMSTRKGMMSRLWVTGIFRNCVAQRKGRRECGETAKDVYIRNNLLRVDHDGNRSLFLILCAILELLSHGQPS